MLIYDKLRYFSHINVSDKVILGDIGQLVKFIG